MQINARVDTTHKVVIDDKEDVAALLAMAEATLAHFDRDVRVDPSPMTYEQKRAYQLAMWLCDRIQ